MRNIKYILAIIVFFTAFSCSDTILDKKPLDQFSDADFWSDPNLAETTINNLYKHMGPDDSFHDNEALTNNSIDGVLWAPSHSINQSGWTAGLSDEVTRYWTKDMGIAHPNSWDGQFMGTKWGLFYSHIRDCNVAIQNLVANEYDDERFMQMLGEAKFHRAYLYHRLTRFYGAVIIVDKAIGLGDEVDLPRNTYNECVDFMVSDLNDAAELLPESWDPANTGRITKGAALALKGRVQLFAERWDDAAATCKTVMDAGTYQLYPDYGDLFLEQNENNQEVILDLQLKYPEFALRLNASCLSPTENGWGAGGPSQNLVDQFELLDGKAWDDPTSEYYDESNPYANRDERFYATVMHDQGVYFGIRVETGQGVDGNGTLIKGSDVNKNNDVTQTGYYMCKATDIDNPDIEYSPWSELPTAGQNCILMRYAEVLLGYAEAKNEQSGPDASVYEAINQVRNRAGLPNLTTGLSQQQMRERIRKERRTELSFEWLYFYDCLRWRERGRFADKPRVVNIEYTYDLNDDGTVKVDETNRKVVLEREFSYADYGQGRVFNLDTDFGWYVPIPQSEIDKNPNVVQNGAFTGNTK